jgi:hypothetical protein
MRADSAIIRAEGIFSKEVSRVEPSMRPERYEFRIEVLGPPPAEPELRRALAEAVEDAARAMSEEDGSAVEAQAELEGAFAGVGETVVVLLVAFFKGAAGAAGAAAGKLFFDKHLKPRLQKLNLIPSDLRKRPQESGGK